MKKSIIYTLGLSVALYALASCAKDDEYTTPQEATEGRYVSIEVNLPDETRVGIDGVDVYWEAGDKMTFYGASSYVSGTSSYSTFTADAVVDGKAVFSGTLSTTITEDQFSGIYPGTSAVINYDATLPLSTLRMIQPTYFQYTYSDGALDPSSIGDYCFMHFYADATSSSSNITGTVKHLMSYVDLDLKNPKGKVSKVFVVMDEALTYPSLKVAQDGTTTLDAYIDYTGTTNSVDGSEDEWVAANVSTLVVELTDSATGSMGVSANADGLIPVRVPFIPQPIDAGEWTVCVLYEDGTEDMCTFVCPSMSLEAGKVHNKGLYLDLGNAVTNTTPIPKMGDFYYTDGTYSSILDSTKTPVGMIYELMGSGLTTTISRIFAVNTGTSAAMFNTSTVTDYASLHKTATEAEDGVAETIVEYTGLASMSELARKLLDLSSVKALGLTSDNTIYEIFAKTSPACYAALGRNTDHSHKVLTGDETGLWYIPSMYEGYRFAVNVNIMQGLKTMYFTSQMSNLPSSITTPTTSGYGYLVPVPATAANYQHLTTTINASEAWTYVRHRAYHYFTTTSTNYLRTYTTAAGTGAVYRPIMRVNTEVLYLNDPASISITTAPSTAIASGDTFQLAAQLLDEAGSTNTNQSLIRWSIAEGDTTGSSISTSGLFSAGSSAGTVTVTAYADGYEDSIVATATINVFVSASEVSFATATASVDMAAGVTYTCDATATGFDSAPTITYSLASTSIATIEGDVITATAAGDVDVIATATGVEQGATVTKTATMTVTFSNTNVVVSSVAISGSDISNGLLSMNLNTTVALTATVSPTYAPDQSVTWSYLEDAGVVAVDASTGVVTALVEGTAMVLATSSNGVTSFVIITVINPDSGVVLPGLGDGGEL